jgi:hypothetical protein
MREEFDRDVATGRPDAAGSGRVDTIEPVVVPDSVGSPPQIAAVDRGTRRLDANKRPHVAAVGGHMSDDDLGVLVVGDGRSGASARMIGTHRAVSVGVGSVVLEEPDAVGRHGRERSPRAVLGERVLKADEVGGGYGRRLCARLCDYRRSTSGTAAASLQRRARQDGKQQGAEESAHPTAPRQRALDEVHGEPPCGWATL